jgi:hypothetical protein
MQNMALNRNLMPDMSGVHFAAQFPKLPVCAGNVIASTFDALRQASRDRGGLTRAVLRLDRKRTETQNQNRNQPEEKLHMR